MIVFTLNLNQKLFIFVILVLVVVSCSKSNKLEIALELAGDNRAELEKVLEHYRKDPADSLKYRAACFLIENMRWHYGPQVKPSEKFWELFVLEDSISGLWKSNPGVVKYEEALREYKTYDKKILINTAIEESVLHDELKSDLQTLDAGFIIENIEAAFRVKNRDWNNNLPFDEFYEYILPYRFHTEAVLPVRNKLNEHFDRLYYTDSLQHDPHKTISFLNNYFWRMNWDWKDEQVKLPDMGFYNIFYWNTTDRRTCNQQVALLGQLMRSVGLPVRELCIPRWRDTDMGHSGCVIPEPDGTLTYFTALYQEPGTVHKPHRQQLATKMYIRTYSAQPNSLYFLKAPNEPIPSFFNSPCLMDVTDKFLETRDIEINLKLESLENNLCWFCIFINGRLTPVAGGRINKRKNSTRFENIPPDLTGIACLMDHTGTLIPCSSFFSVTGNGVEYIAPDDNNTNLLLLRKFPVKEKMQDIACAIAGTKIQGANLPDFSDTVTLYSITDTLQMYLQDLVFCNTNRYRYYRLLANDKELNIAELELITQANAPGRAEASPLPVFEKDLPAREVYYKIPYTTMPGVIDSTLNDGKMLTYCNRKRIDLDAGKPQLINRVRIAPRNAHNGIVAGDNYQLFYWNNEWISAGIQQAKINVLEFTGVPANTLYWLRNLDQGKEEQPFFYVDGKQVFINQP